MSPQTTVFVLLCLPAVFSHPAQLLLTTDKEVFDEQSDASFPPGLLLVCVRFIPFFICFDYFL